MSVVVDGMDNRNERCFGPLGEHIEFFCERLYA